MFSSLFSAAPVDPHAPNFFSTTTNVSESDLFGPLEPKDTEWLCAGGFVTETQTFYTITEEGVSIMVQVIHSSTGVWYPTIQFNFKTFDPRTKQRNWKTINVTNFVTPPSANLDKRSSKADQFSLTYKESPSNTEYPESYILSGNLAADLQFSFEFQRIGTIPGWKLGQGPKAGYSYFGPDLERPEGYVVHRFWPRFKASGHIISEGKANAVQGHGIFIHAIQGMRPNLVASAWNFHHFESKEAGGVSALQMEFTTCDTHGKKGNGSGRVPVNIGSLVINNKLVSITAETTWPGEKRTDGVVSRTTHLDPVFDPETGYHQPTRQLLEWRGPSIVAEAPGTITGKIEADVGNVGAPKGLIEKVDVLAEIPYVLKVAVNYVAGTKPYIYQWLNPGKIHLTGPEEIAPGLSSGLDVDGTLYTESTFIS